jgi:hypothetical protein
VAFKHPPSLGYQVILRDYLAILSGLSQSLDYFVQYLVNLAVGSFSVIKVIPMIRDPPGLTLDQFSTRIATGS